MIRSRNISRGLSDGTKTKVYDADEKRCLGEFESNRAAAMFIGVSRRTLTLAKNRKSIIQAKTNKLNKRLAIR